MPKQSLAVISLLVTFKQKDGRDARPTLPSSLPAEALAKERPRDPLPHSLQSASSYTSDELPRKDEV
jgi:hypothetical protein